MNPLLICWACIGIAGIVSTGYIVWLNRHNDYEGQ